MFLVVQWWSTKGLSEYRESHVCSGSRRPSDHSSMRPLSTRVLVWGWGKRKRKRIWSLHTQRAQLPLSPYLIGISERRKRRTGERERIVLSLWLVLSTFPKRNNSQGGKAARFARSLWNDSFAIHDLHQWWGQKTCFFTGRLHNQINGEGKERSRRCCDGSSLAFVSPPISR